MTKGIDKILLSAFEYLKAGNLDRAEKTYKEILRVQPDNVNALHFLGITYYRQKRYDSAIKCVKKALDLKPDYLDAYNNLGIILQDVRRIDEATSCFRKALELNPNFVEANVNLGNILQVKGFLDEAAFYFQKALGLNPELVEVHVSLGNILRLKGSYDEAIRHLQKAVQLNPNFYGTYNDLGIAFLEKQQFDDAFVCFREAIRLNPRFVQSHVNLGNVLQSKGLLDDAEARLREAVMLDPDNASANYNLALTLLQSGNFREGWEKYEWRRGIESLSYLRVNLSKPLWDGSEMNGGRVLLLGEQGFGDIIQFVRYAPFVAQRGAKVVMCCHPELKSLIRNVDRVEEVVTYGERLPEFDVYCPLLSLPFVFHSAIEDIPANIPYIRVDPSLSRKWRDRIQAGPPGPKVGLVWSGNPKNVRLRYKSFSLQAFSPLAELGGATFYSLQKGEASEQAKKPPQGMNLLDFTEEIRDFSDTAALMENLDLVVSVDTASAHLAGALGRPVWTLLPYPADWRWMLGRDDSPWYPSMRLFRQLSPGRWDALIVRVRERLGEFLKGGKKGEA